MPSEYVMYLSMLLVGALAIAGISATMMSLNNTIENRAIKTELEHILQKISEVIHNVRNEGQKEIEQGAQSFDLIVMLNMPQKVQNEEYKVEVTSSSASYYLKATLVHQTNVNVVISLQISPNELSISGSLSSTSSTNKVMFSYDGQNIEIFLES